MHRQAGKKQIFGYDPVMDLLSPLFLEFCSSYRLIFVPDPIADPQKLSSLL